jgi:hypothetical protein
VRFIEYDACPVRGFQRGRAFAQDVVVHDAPARSAIITYHERRDAGLSLEHVHHMARCRGRNLARPVSLDRCGTDHEVRTRGRGLAQRDDGLACFAQAHVIGQDRTPALEQEGDTFHLVCEEAMCDARRALLAVFAVLRRGSNRVLLFCHWARLLHRELAGSASPIDCFVGFPPKRSV